MNKKDNLLFLVFVLLIIVVGSAFLYLDQQKTSSLNPNHQTQAPEKTSNSPKPTTSLENHCLERGGQVVGEGVCFFPIATTSATTKKQAEEIKTIKGTISAVDKDQITLKTTQGNLSFTITPQSLFFQSNEETGKEEEITILSAKKIEFSSLALEKSVLVKARDGTINELYLLKEQPNN